MAIIFVISVLFLIVSVSYEYYLRRKRNKADLLPLRKEIVQELIKDIKLSKLDLVLSKKGPPDSSTQFTLLEAKKYIDNGRELSLPMYDSYPLLFTDNFNQVLDFRKYIDNKFLPQEIRSELSDFCNTSYSRVNPQGMYFIILPNYTFEKAGIDNDSEGLFIGNGDAYTSWVSFKECCHNLYYVITQWLEENDAFESNMISNEIEYFES